MHLAPPTGVMPPALDNAVAERVAPISVALKIVVFYQHFQHVAHVVVVNDIDLVPDEVRQLFNVIGADIAQRASNAHRPNRASRAE